MSERFFSSSPILNDVTTLDEHEAHHLMHVMRAAPGDQVTLFDGSGIEFDSRVENLGRSSVKLRIIARREVNRELPFELSIGVALPKGDRQKWLVEKLTELGVTRLVPLVTERGVAQPNDSAIERLQRGVVEACKQCGRNRLMRIEEPLPLQEWLRLDAGRDAIRLFAHPGGAAISDIGAQRRGPTQIAIGPEGGFTDVEVSRAIGGGWNTIDLGSRILRVETAAVALAAIVPSATMTA